MISAGIDIGSRTVKLVVLSHDGIVLTRKSENSFNPLEVCQRLLDGVTLDVIKATGYGRYLFAEKFGCEVISEIKAVALGVRREFPSCRTVLDIGGQDIKAISLDGGGRVRKFEMNDKCSAGTGRFLEIMAMTLGLSLAEFNAVARGAGRAEKINSMCTVFAESEVISLLSSGAKRGEIALGIHQSIIGRGRAMLGRIGPTDDFVFLGGVAKNDCAAFLLEEALQMEVQIPDDPQVVGALGCAIYGMDNS